MYQKCGIITIHDSKNCIAISTQAYSHLEPLDFVAVAPTTATPLSSSSTQFERKSFVKGIERRMDVSDTNSVEVLNNKLPVIFHKPNVHTVQRQPPSNFFAPDRGLKIRNNLPAATEPSVLLYFYSMFLSIVFVLYSIMLF